MQENNENEMNISLPDSNTDEPITEPDNVVGDHQPTNGPADQEQHDEETNDLFVSNELLSRVRWALIPFVNGNTYRGVSGEMRVHANAEEKKWGQQVIGRDSKNWTTQLGENLVRDILALKGENPRRPRRLKGYAPDWETDNAIWEVKTRSWTTSGTAGEKVYGTMYKYADISEIYGKPLKIVCVAYQEWELVNGTTKIFGTESVRQQKFLDLARICDINYIKFRDILPESIISRI